MRISDASGGYAPIGPIHVRLSGVTRMNADGDEVASVNAPTVTEATVALDRVAKVIGADGVDGVKTDYRRAAVAAGLQVRVEVQAWGTAFTQGESDAGDTPPLESAPEKD